MPIVPQKPIPEPLDTSYISGKKKVGKAKFPPWVEFVAPIIAWFIIVSCYFAFMMFTCDAGLGCGILVLWLFVESAVLFPIIVIPYWVYVFLKRR